MFALISFVSAIMSFFYFFGWYNTGFEDTYFLGFISLFFCAIISFSLFSLKIEFKEQEKRIKELEEKLDTNNEKTGD